MGGIVYFDITIQPASYAYRDSIKMLIGLCALVINGVAQEEPPSSL